MKELILLSGLGILSLVAEILNVRRLIYPMIILGLLITIGFCIQDFGLNENVYGMLVLDKLPLLFIILSTVIAVFWFVMAKKYFTSDHYISDHFSLVLFSLVGVFLLTSYIHLSMLFLGIEILSIPVYILAGSDKRNIYSNEASFKYFLLGAFASGFLLLGITFLYGALGSFDIRQLVTSSIGQYGISQQLMVIGVLLILVAFAFKMSAVPFHFWAPDVYTGAPTSITAFMATIVKIGAVAGFYRLFSLLLSFYSYYADILVMIAILSIVVGNIIAATQNNVKRMLAYSSIGHAGFIILGIATLTELRSYVTGGITWYYLASYALSSLLAFWVLIIVSNTSKSEGIAVFNGLIKRSPFLAIVMSVAILSMAGIPPLSGFFAKYFILFNVIQDSRIIIAVIAILASLIGVYYYFKIIIAMFSASDNQEFAIDIPTFHKFALAILALAIIILGLVPDFIFHVIIR